MVHLRCRSRRARWQSLPLCPLSTSLWITWDARAAEHRDIFSPFVHSLLLCGPPEMQVQQSTETYSPPVSTLYISVAHLRCRYSRIQWHIHPLCPLSISLWPSWDAGAGGTVTYSPTCVHSLLLSGPLELQVRQSELSYFLSVSTL